MLDTTRASGVAVHLIEDGPPTQLDPSVEHTAYWIIQEGPANTLKHGGLGAEADIHLEWQPNDLRITTRSRAGLIGLDRVNGEPESGHGLDGLRQRVARVGGTLDIRPGSNDFLLVAVLPLGDRLPQKRPHESRQRCHHLDKLTQASRGITSALLLLDSSRADDDR